MKSRSIFSKLFSPTVAGLDIADQSVKYAVLEPGEDGYTLLRHGAVPLPEGIIVDGDIRDPLRLTNILADIKRKGNFTHARVSLPESHLFIVENAGVTPHASELRAHALTRALVQNAEQNTRTTMLVNFGETQTDIAISHNGKVYYTKSIALPQNPTQTLMDTFGISAHAAKDMKRSIGISRNGEHEAIFAALVPDISALSKQLNTVFIDWHTHETEHRPQIEKIILAGSNAHINGLPEYLSSSLRTPVTLGNPWTNLNTLKSYIPPMHAEEALGYAAALGLALGK